MLVIRFRGEGDEGQVLRDTESLLGHPGEGRKSVSGFRGDDGGWRVFESKGASKDCRKTRGWSFLNHRDDGADFASVGKGLSETFFGRL